MKITMREFLELDVAGLLAVNGGSGCGGAASTMESGTGTMASASGGGSPMSSGSRTDSTPTGSGTCGGANAGDSNSGGQGGYGSDTPTDNAPTGTGTCGGTNVNATPNDASVGVASIVPDAVDYSNNAWVMESMENKGFEFLSDDNSQGYAAGSERKYYQKELTDAMTNSELSVTQDTYVISGSPTAGFGHEDFCVYTITHRETGDVLFRMADINNDGQVDYVER